jgi:hypothetical protein
MFRISKTIRSAIVAGVELLSVEAFKRVARAYNRRHMYENGEPIDIQREAAWQHLMKSLVVLGGTHAHVIAPLFGIAVPDKEHAYDEMRREVGSILGMNPLPIVYTDSKFDAPKVTITGPSGDETGPSEVKS